MRRSCTSDILKILFAYIAWVLPLTVIVVSSGSDVSRASTPTAFGIVIMLMRDCLVQSVGKGAMIATTIYTTIISIVSVADKCLLSRSDDVTTSPLRLIDVLLHHAVTFNGISVAHAFMLRGGQPTSVIAKWFIHIPNTRLACAGVAALVACVLCAAYIYLIHGRLTLAIGELWSTSPSLRVIARGEFNTYVQTGDEHEEVLHNAHTDDRFDGCVVDEATEHDAVDLIHVAEDDSQDALPATDNSGNDVVVGDQCVSVDDMSERVDGDVTSGVGEPLRVQGAIDAEIPLTTAFDDYHMPLSLLDNKHQQQCNLDDQEAYADHCAAKLAKTLVDFGVRGSIVDFKIGPIVTLYEYEPVSGVKSSKVVGLSEDIARSLCAQSARVSPIQGKPSIGIEIPNIQREIVDFGELMSKLNEPSLTEEMLLPITLGKTIDGTPFFADLAKMPHLLIAGTTGSGKSVAINAIILALIFQFSPAVCRMLMVDPKVLELSVYNDIPHLIAPVVTESRMAVVALKWVTRQMEMRYKLMAKAGARNIAAFNQMAGQTGSSCVPMPYIVVIVDEMADLMVLAGKTIESSIQRLSQMARAAGIHIIMATQRPSVDVITGVIKANFPTRISFAVSSRFDSRTILGEQGAEQLLGMGDMLYMCGGHKIKRLHGPFVSDQEVINVVNHLQAKWGGPMYAVDFALHMADDNEDCSVHKCNDKSQNRDDADTDCDNMSDEELYTRALHLVMSRRRPTASFLQRELRIGYNKASRLIEMMEKRGAVSEPDHSGRRTVYSPDE